MFATKKDLNNHFESTRFELSQLQERYWSLWHKHELLLEHFGLSEYTTPETKELRTKGGPEHGA